LLALYLLIFYSSATSKPPEYLSVSIYSESFTETACQKLLLLVGINILTYRRYCDIPPILVGHQPPPRQIPTAVAGGRQLEGGDVGGWIWVPWQRPGEVRVRLSSVIAHETNPLPLSLYIGTKKRE
jgi:hypothetical protein